MLKGDLKTVFSSVIKAMGSTLGACGDVNRNVCGTPAPFTDRPEYKFSDKARVRGNNPGITLRRRFRLYCAFSLHLAAFW